MDNNTGKTIKGLAILFLVICILGCVIAGIILLSNEMTVGLGVTLLLGGPIASIIGFYLLYGYGELINKVCIIENYITTKQPSNTKTDDNSKEINKVNQSNSQTPIADETQNTSVNSQDITQ